MLEFWFNQTTSISYKLTLLFIAIAIAVTLYVIHPMPYQLILLFVATGIIFLICRMCQIHLIQGDRTRPLQRIFMWIPLALLAAIIFTKAIDHLLEWGVQGIAFMIITICICSMHILFKKPSA